MTIPERALVLLEEREPRAPEDLAAALGCSPAEAIAALDRSPDFRRCAPPQGARCFWWRRCHFAIARVRALRRSGEIADGDPAPVEDVPPAPIIGR